MKAADGEALFAPYRDGTLLTYRNLVVPGSRLAGLGFIRGRAQREVEATVRAIAAQVVTMRTNDRPRLDEQVRALRRLPDSVSTRPSAGCAEGRAFLSDCRFPTLDRRDSPVRAAPREMAPDL